MFLTTDEIRTLTGVKRPSSQLKWLRERGWRHEVDAYGRPVVATAEVEARLVGSGRKKRKAEPNWDALKTMRNEKNK